MSGPELDPLRRNFDVADLTAAVARHDITATIVVQTVADLAETDELLDLAAEHTLIAGVVGYVDIAARDVGQQLDRLLTHPSGRWLVGVRSLVQYEMDPAWLGRPDVAAGISAVAERGLVHDLLILPHQIAATVDAVRAEPGGRFVIDHLAKPDIAAGPWEPWATGLAALAVNDNVVAKVSGLVTEADWATWTDDDIRPFVDHALQCFGPDRLLFGSDWPVCTLAASYAQIVSSIESFTSQLSADDCALVLGGTASATYSLSERIDEIRVDLPIDHQEIP